MTIVQEKGKEIDYVAKQANLTVQIESEHLAARKWWEDFGPCYIERSNPNDFTYENRIKILETKLHDEKYQNVNLSTSSSSYGQGNPFHACGVKYHGIKKDRTLSSSMG